MGIKDEGFDRLMAGNVASNDPELGQVATFLERVRQASPPAEVTHLEAAHMARARVALSALGSPRAPRRERRIGWSRRLVVGSVLGVFGAMSAGVGVAMAMGVDPIQVIIHLPQIIVPNADPSVKPAKPTERPTQKPSTHPSQASGQESEDESEDAEHKSSEASEHSRSVGSEDHPSPNPHSTVTGSANAENDQEHGKDDEAKASASAKASARASEKAAKPTATASKDEDH